MADNEAKPAEGGAGGSGGAASGEAPKKKSPVKVIAIVAVLMIVQGVSVFIIAGATGKKQPEAKAHGIHPDPEAEGKALAEIELLSEKFQNMQTGRVWIWDTAVFLKVRNKHKESVAKELERRAAEIREGVALIFRRAQHSHLKEPGLETINRQLSAYLNKLLGEDEEGKPKIERVIIPRCRGFAAD